MNPFSIRALGGLALLSWSMMPAALVVAQDTVNYPSIGKVLRFDKRIDQLLDKEATIEVLSSGFDWAEGPVWVKEEGSHGYLLFSDIPPNKVMKWDPVRGLSTYLYPISSPC